jgi:fructose-bisphosphate aldolase class II
MLVTLNEILPAAKAGHYAVGLFNTVNLEMAKGVLAAAEALRSPVIIGTAEILLPYAELEELAYFLVPMAEKASVPVVLHYDHGLTEERVHQAMDLGFRSVMYDCSTLDFDGNCKAVADLVKEAHQRGVSVEAELGHVGANETSAESAASDDSIYTEPEEARRFWEKTGVDALAVAIGTAHGAYKSKPRLDFERLEQIASVVGAPLVLHGGSGLTDDDFRRTIEKGIAKVNIFTDINCAAAKAAHDHWKDGKGLTDLMPEIAAAVQAETMKKMKIFGSEGRA